MFKWLFCLSTLILFQCSLKVVNFTNEKADFERYKSFRVINYKAENSQLDQNSRNIFQLLESEISNEMTRRNYSLSNISPDLLVRYELISNQNTETRRTDYNYGYYVVPNFSTTTFITSVLLIELIDFSSKKIVWQASVDLKDLSKKTEQNEMLKSAVKQTFNTYLHTSGNNEEHPNLIMKK